MLSLSRSLLFPLFFVFFFSPSLCIVLNDEFLPARASTFSETFGRAAFRASKQKKAKAAALWCLGIIIFSFFLLFFCGPEKKRKKKEIHENQQQAESSSSTLANGLALWRCAVSLWSRAKRPDEEAGRVNED
jgi:hypothetical protein